MFSFGRSDVRQFGGVGAMVEEPALRLSIEPADHFQVHGQQVRRIREATESILKRLLPEGGDESDLDAVPVAIELERSPRQHVGLGAGTQLGLSLAAALNAAFNRPAPTIDSLARLAGRGLRSAVGTHGFQHGGLLVEAGKYESEAISPLVARIELPEQWRFVLLTPLEAIGISGDKERAAFALLPPVPLETTERLVGEVLLELSPAAVAADFAAFSASLHRFNATAGSLFASVQGGPFAAGPTSTLVEWLRRVGIEGVGQTSWGPTVFALCSDDEHARHCFNHARQQWPADQLEIVVSPPANRGAQIQLG
jgi:beta-RFAP synthase